jgi:TPR repeat protein
MDDPSPLEAGKKALAEGDRERALVLLTPLATRGDPDAQYHLGRVFSSMQWGGFDVAEAIRWYEAAAAQGHVLATYALADLYDPSWLRDERFGIVQDQEKSRGYYRARLGGLQAMALAGDAAAAELLGQIYFLGCLGEPNVEEAIRWYAVCFDNGWRCVADTLCGLCGGIGDDERALFWFRKMREHGLQFTVNYAWEGRMVAKGLLEPWEATPR